MLEFDLRQFTPFQEAKGPCQEPFYIHDVCIHSEQIVRERSLFFALGGKTKSGIEFASKAIKNGACAVLAASSLKARVSPKEREKALWIFVEDPVRSLQKLAHLYRQKTRAKILAITGSYGKTMLKDLLAKIFKEAFCSPESFNSQIGAALSLFQISNFDSFAIIEAGISQKGEMEKLQEMILPDFGILTNISDAHLSELGSLETTAKEKLKLFKDLPGWLLAPKSSFLENAAQRYIDYKQKHQDLPHLELIQHGHYLINFPGDPKSSFELKKNIPPAYLPDLFQMALKAAFLLQKKPQEILDILEDYEAEPMRAESFRLPNGANVFNEAYCASSLSFQFALKKCLQQKSAGRRILLFGDLRVEKTQKEAALKSIARQVNQEKLDQFILFPSQPLLEKLLKVPFQSFENLEKAIEALKKSSREGDIIVIKEAHKTPLERISELFLEGKQCNYLNIHLNAIYANIEKIAQGKDVMLMLKAQGYGSDSPLLARHLNAFGYDYFGLAHTSEAISLKSAGIKGRFFVLHAMPQEAKEIVAANLEIAISDHEMLQALAKECKIQKREIALHLHIDTGMSRFGCRPEEAIALAKEIDKQPFFRFEGVMTHLACAENAAQDPFSVKQIERFESILEELEQLKIRVRYIHALNTSASIRFSKWPSNLVRIGLGMFGISPSDDVREKLSLKAALSLQSKIVAIKDCKEGETVSYGRNYLVQNAREEIGIVPLGYFDGMHQKYSGKGSLLVDGKPLPMIGSICMDFMMLNVSALPGIKTLQNVLLFGQDEVGHFRSIEDFAKEIEASVYELISCLGPRIQRVFIEEEKKSPQS